MTSQEREQLWKTHVEQWRASGLSQRAFALRHGHAVRQMGYWVRRFGGNAPAPGMLPVTLQREPAAVPLALNLRSPSGWTMTLPPNVATDWLATLLRAL